MSSEPNGSEPFTFGFGVSEVVAVVAALLLRNCSSLTFVTPKNSERPKGSVDDTDFDSGVSLPCGEFFFVSRLVG